MRIIAIRGVAVQHSVFVEARGPDADAALEVILDRDDNRRGMPPIAAAVLEGATVARAACKTPGLVGKGVMVLIRERSERLVANVDPVAVAAEFRSRGGVLQI